jgi:CRISPR-associated protein Cas2
MRRCFLVCYDISAPARWRKVYKTMKGYGEHWQFSVFFCVLKDIDRVRMQAELEDVMNLDKDVAMIIDLGPDEEAARKAAVMLGPGAPQQDKDIVVV